MSRLNDLVQGTLNLKNLALQSMHGWAIAQQEKALLKAGS
jgi:hypothetical protein